MRKETNQTKKETNEKTHFHFLPRLNLNYRKIPKISPRAYIFQRPFLRGLCKERFSMNSLFASNIIYSFQIFALKLFLVIHTEFA